MSWRLGILAPSLGLERAEVRNCDTFGWHGPPTWLHD